MMHLNTGKYATRVTARARGVQRARLICRAGIVEPGSTVLVAGATGGVGQLTTAKLLDRGFKVKALSRSKDKALSLFSNHPNLEVVVGDSRDATTLADPLFDVDAVACCTGTTAFPSDRWKGNNGPRPTDLVGTVNLIKACTRTCKRFVLVTSAGVERTKEFPWAILNTFGVLTFKHQAELELIESGLPYTILRPGRLTDGPYTSYDLNTLLKATAGSRRAVQLAARDSLAGEASRIEVAEAVVQALRQPRTENRCFAISSSEGDGPGEDAAKWEALFASAYADQVLAV